MSAHWHVGMEVECIDDKDAKELVAGERYTVTKVGFGHGLFKGRIWSGVCICLRGATSYTLCGDPHTEGFAACRFRPVQKRKTDISIFKTLLNPSKDETIRELEAEMLDYSDCVVPR